MLCMCSPGNFYFGLVWFWFFQGFSVALEPVLELVLVAHSLGTGKIKLVLPEIVTQ